MSHAWGRCRSLTQSDERDMARSFKTFAEGREEEMRGGEEGEEGGRQREEEGKGTICDPLVRLSCFQGRADKTTGPLTLLA